MDKKFLITQAQRRIYEIEEKYGDGRHVPPHIVEFFKLNKLIALADFGSYFEEMGGPLGIYGPDAQDGKQEMGHGVLTGFERDCIRLVNERAERNTHDEPRRLAVLDSRRVP